MSLSLPYTSLWRTRIASECQWEHARVRTWQCHVQDASESSLHYWRQWTRPQCNTIRAIAIEELSRNCHPHLWTVYTDGGCLELHPRQLQVPTRSPECLNNKAVELWYKALLPAFLPARRRSQPIGVGSFGYCTGWSLRRHRVTKSLILWQPRLNCR